MLNPTFLPEILSPAGDEEAVKSAVQMGARAVYLGGDDFSARQNAKNFDKETLRSTVLYCHSRGVLVYLAINTLIFDYQIDDLKNSIKFACEIGIDAIIVQDFATYKIVKLCCGDMPIHASTQMSIHSVSGAKLLKDIGFSRVVLARELSFEQIKKITQTVDIETEVFVHGALCMSVSGQCYISSMIGARSGNRGSCAGTCRLPYSSTNDSNRYDLSLKDLCLVDEVQKLASIGVSSIKIEGRMKRPEYVAVATKTYKNALLGEDYDTKTLQAVFSRSGFTDGYFNNKKPDEMFGIRKKEDVISASSSLLKEIANSYKKELIQIPVEFNITIKKDEPILLVAKDINGNIVTVEGETPEIALNKPTDESLCKKALSKLGGTIFFLDKLEFNIEDGLMVRASSLNDLRRQAIDSLIQKREQINPIAFNDSDITITKASQVSQNHKIARFYSFKQIDITVLDNFEYFILPLNEVNTHKQELLKLAPKLILELPRLMITNEEEVISTTSSLKQMGYKFILANNLAHIQIAKDLDLLVFGGEFLNCTNSLSVEILSNLPNSQMLAQTISFESAIKYAKRISSPVKKAMIVYGYLPLMLFKTCPMKNQSDCGKCSKKLTDRLNKTLTLLCYGRNYTELLNCDVLYLADKIEDFALIDYHIFYFTTETKNEISTILDNYKTKNNKSSNPDVNLTRGLYYRGV